MEDVIDKLKNTQYLIQVKVDELRDLLLKYLESEVGVRDESWNILGTIYYDGVPQTIHSLDHSFKFINICLSKTTESGNFDQKLFQVSHEVVHLLNPTGGRIASNLEEGFATWFSVYICEIVVPSYKAEQQILQDTCNYKKQFELVRKLEDPFELIRKIRSNGYTMSNVTKEFFKRNTESKYSEEEIDFLLENFYKDE